MEIVLGVKRDIINKYLIECGYFTDKTVIDLINQNLEGRERESAEQDPSFKQVIPYLIIKNNDDYLLYTRTKKQSETRLHSKLSLGVGGHINPIDQEDINPEMVIPECLERELEEEISIELKKTPEFKGFINDDTNEVGRVHLGIVYFAEAKSDAFTVNEHDKIIAEWVSIRDLELKYDNMETWSQIVFNNIIK